MLHVIINVGETNSQYNQLCLPLVDRQDISICCYFEPEIQPPPAIEVHTGRGRTFGFFRALNSALDTDPDVISVHAPQTGALVVVFALLSLRWMKMRPKMVYTVRDAFYDYGRRNQLLMLLSLVSFAEIVFCSRAAYDSVPWIGKRLAGKRWHVVQNAADIDRVDSVLTTTPRARTTRFSALSVARLEPVKNHFVVLDAFGQAGRADSQLTFIGRGSLESELRRRISDLGLGERVVLTGLLPREQVFARMAEAHVLISASRGEGLPVAVIEAMAAQCPVILSDIAPHREVADGADFIPLIHPDDVDGFARELRRFEQMGADELAELGRACREHVLARFTLPTMHAGLDEVYRQLPGLSDHTSLST